MGTVSPLHPREIRYPHRRVGRVGKNVSLFVSTDNVLSMGMCMHPPYLPLGRTLETPRLELHYRAVHSSQAVAPPYLS